MDGILRPIEAADLSAFHRLRLESLLENPEAFGSDHARELAWAPEHYLPRIDAKTGHFILGAFVGSSLVACVGFGRPDSLKQRHRAFVWGMYVQPKNRGLGLGRRLMQALVLRARGIDGLLQIRLDVTTGNMKALSLYRSLDFVLCGQEPKAMQIDGNFYDNCLMYLDLSQSTITDCQAKGSANA